MDNNVHNPTISVIVPVYKVESYLRECLDSILAQTFTDFELIVVDDGSPDTCGAICDEYALRDSRIIVIHQENKGVSAARNAAMDIMRGKYVAFIDSDDFIAAEYLESLHQGIVAANADISMCGWYMCNEVGDNITEIHKYTDEIRTISGRDLCFMRYQKCLVIAVWCKLFSRTILKNIRFPVGSASEDQAVIPGLYYAAERVCLLDKQMYYYRVRERSLAHDSFSAKYFDNIIHMNAHIVFLEKEGDIELLKLAVALRDRVLSMYTINAKAKGIEKVPAGCKMGILKALHIMRKTCDNDTFTWNLAKIYPRAIRPYAYIRKIESMITGKPL